MVKKKGPSPTRGFGDLNPLGSPLIPKRKIYYDTDPNSYVQKSSKDQNTVNIHANQNEYKAKVLYAWSAIENPLGLNNFWGLIPGDRSLIYVLARVPIVHASLLPEPSGPKDVDTILLYMSTGLFTSKFKDAQLPEYDTDINVTWEDVQNKRGGIYLGPVDADAPGKTQIIIQGGGAITGIPGASGAVYAAGTPYNPALASRARSNKLEMDSSGRLGPKIGMHMWLHNNSWVNKMASLGYLGAKEGNIYKDLKEMGIDAVSIKVCCERDYNTKGKGWRKGLPISAEVQLARAAGFALDDIHFWGFQWEPTLERAIANATTAANLCVETGVKHYHWDGENKWGNWKKEGDLIVHSSQFVGTNRGWHGNKAQYTHIGQTAVQFCATFREICPDITLWNLGWAEVMPIDAWNSFDIYEPQLWGGKYISKRINAKYKTYNDILKAGGDFKLFAPMLPSPNVTTKHGMWTGNNGPQAFIKEHRNEIPWVWLFSFHINNIILESAGNPNLPTMLEDLTKIWSGGSVGPIAEGVKSDMERQAQKERLVGAVADACGGTPGVSSPPDLWKTTECKDAKKALEEFLAAIDYSEVAS